MNIRTRVTRLSAEAVWIGGGQAVAMIVALLGIGQLTRYLPPADYGQFAVAFSAASLLHLWMGSIAAAVLRFTPAAQEQGEIRTLMAALRRTLIARIQWLVGIAMVASTAAWLRHSLDLAALILATAGYAVAAGLMLNADGFLNASRRRPQLAIHKALQQVFNYAAALALLQITPCAALTMTGFLIGTLIIAVSELRVVRNALPPADATPPDPAAVDAYAARLRDYGRPYERWGVPGWVQTSCDRWALAAFASTRETGLYAVAYQLGFSPLALSAQLLVQVVEPIAYARAGDGSDPHRVQHAQRVRHWTIVFFIVACALGVVGTWLFKDVVFDLLVDPNYRTGAVWLPWLVLVAMLTGLGNIEAMRWFIHAQPRRLQAARIGTSIAGCVLITTGAIVAGTSGVIAGQIAAAGLFLVWVRRLH